MTKFKLPLLMREEKLPGIEHTQMALLSPASSRQNHLHYSPQTAIQQSRSSALLTWTRPHNLDSIKLKVLSHEHELRPKETTLYPPYQQAAAQGLQRVYIFEGVRSWCYAWYYAGRHCWASGAYLSLAPTESAIIGIAVSSTGFFSWSKKCFCSEAFSHQLSMLLRGWQKHRTNARP